MFPYKYYSRLFPASTHGWSKLMISGIPEHACGSLLDEFCLIRGILPDTINRRDSFHLMAWCMEPELIPASMDLLIEEPTPAFVQGTPVLCALSYPVSIMTSASLTPAEDPPLSPPPASGAQGSGNRRHPRSLSTGSRPGLASTGGHDQASFALEGTLELYAGARWMQPQGILVLGPV